MIFGDLHAERQELHHPVSVNIHEFAVFGGENQRRWMPKINESKISIRAYFAVEHGGNFLRVLVLAPTEGIPRRNGLCQSQVDSLEKLRSRFSAVIEVGEHEGMKGVVNRRSDFR